jgi:hypothetical protein
MLEVSPLTSRDVIVSGEAWLVYLLPYLVPIPLVRPQMEGKQRGGVATRGGAWCKGHEGVGKQVFRRWRYSTICGDQLDVPCFVLVFVSEWCVILWCCTLPSLCLYLLLLNRSL